MTRREKRRHSFFFYAEIGQKNCRKPYKINLPSDAEVDFKSIIYRKNRRNAEGIAKLDAEPFGKKFIAPRWNNGFALS